MTFDPDRVRADIERLRVADADLRVFGAIGHRHRLRPCLTAEELAAAEAFFRVTFPDEYRTFLLRVGNGGAGPFYGVFPLVRADGGWRSEGDSGDMFGDVAAPVPHVDAWNPAADPMWKWPERDWSADETLYDAEYEAWREKFDPVYGGPEHTAGAISVCDVGCAKRKWLVVSGPAAGQIWADDRADYEGLSPLLDPAGRRHTFGSWYTSWLAQTLAEVADGSASTPARHPDSDFVERLGPEDSARPCAESGCNRGAVRFSVLCKPHHFRMIQHRPYPFAE